MCLLLEISIIFRDSDIQFFWRRFAQWSRDDLDGTLKWSHIRVVVVQGERHQRSLAVRIEKGCEGRRHWTCEHIIC